MVVALGYLEGLPPEGKGLEKVAASGPGGQGAPDAASGKGWTLDCCCMRIPGCPAGPKLTTGHQRTQEGRGCYLVPSGSFLSKDVLRGMAAWACWSSG